MKELPMQRECFAYKDGKCMALSQPICKKRNCPFYKTQHQIRAQRVNCRARLKGLYGIHEHLHEKYKYTKGELKNESI